MGIDQIKNRKSVRINVPGMHCGNCVAKVAKALAAVDGVEVTNLAIGSATILLQEERSSVHDVIAAVARAGYPAVVDES